MTDFKYPFPYLPETDEEKRAGSFPIRVQENFDALKKNGLTERGSPFVTIAAANTPLQQRRWATYKCGGTDDQNTLAQALTAGHTFLWLLPGDFYFTGPPYEYLGDVGLAADTWVGITGHGRATVIHIDGADAVAFMPGLNDGVAAEVSHMAFVSTSDGADSVIEAGFTSIEGRVLLSDLYFETPNDGIGGYATAILSLGNVTMDNITFGFFDCFFMGIQPGYNDIIRNLTSTDFHGPTIIDAASETKLQIVNASLTDNACSNAAIDLSTSTDCLLQGCTVTGTTGGTADVVTTGATRLREVGNLIDVEV